MNTKRNCASSSDRTAALLSAMAQIRAALSVDRGHGGDRGNGLFNGRRSAVAASMRVSRGLFRPRNTKYRCAGLRCSVNWAGAQGLELESRRGGDWRLALRPVSRRSRPRTGHSFLIKEKDPARIARARYEQMDNGKLGRGRRRGRARHRARWSWTPKSANDTTPAAHASRHAATVGRGGSTFTTSATSAGLSAVARSKYLRARRSSSDRALVAAFPKTRS